MVLVTFGSIDQYVSTLGSLDIKSNLFLVNNSKRDHAEENTVFLDLSIHKKGFFAKSGLL